MKRVFIASLAIVALLGAGCGPESLQTNNESPSQTQKTPPPEPPPNVPKPTPVHPEGT